MVPHRIVVGVDGSPGSERAVRWAAARAKESGAEVILVHAMDADTQFWHDLPPFGFTSWRSGLKARLRTTWSEPLQRAHVQHRSMLVEADPVSALTSVAAAEHAELIAVGAPSKGHLTDRFIGSLTQRLLHRGRHPVTVVPADWAEDGGVDVGERQWSPALA